MSEIDLSAKGNASKASLPKITAKARELRDTELKLKELEEQLKDLNSRKQTLMRETLPNLLQEAGLTSLTIEKEGNYPAFELKLSPYYSANIAAGWPEDKRQKGFKTLVDEGASDLIKVNVSVEFDKGDHKKAQKIVKELAKQGLNVAMKENVHFQSLTAWLKDQVENHSHMPPLEDIGGTVGQVVKMKEK